MLASLRASVHSFKSLAVGSVRQTSHIFHPDLQRDRQTDRERARIPFHKRGCPKTSAHTVLYSVLHPNSQGQGAVGQSHFLQTSTCDWPCCKPTERVEEGSPESQICLSVRPQSSCPPTSPLHSYLRHAQASCQGGFLCHRVARCRVLLVLACAGTHCSGHDADRTTYLSPHNSLLVCRHARDQSHERTFTSDVK